MSQNFKAGGTMVWNPSSGAGRLFVRSADALAPLVDLPTGIRLGHPGDPDEWVVDMPAFETFVDALADRYQRSTHLILRSLMALTCPMSPSPRAASVPALPRAGCAN